MRARPQKPTLPKIMYDIDKIRKIIGLDISLSNTGITELVGPHFLASTFTTKSTEPHIPRCKRIARKLSGSRASITLSDTEVVYVREDYAYGAQGVADVLLKELGGIVKLSFFEEGHLIHSMPIGSWKKFVTGHGNADKKMVQRSLTSLLGSAQVSDWTEHDFDAAGIAITAQAVIYREHAVGLMPYQSEVIQNLIESSNSLVLLDI